MHIFYSSKIVRALAGTAVGMGLLLGGAGVASAATLTQGQISAVVTLLQAFGADPAVVANVQATLGGQATTGTGTSTTTTSGTPTAINVYMIGNLKHGDSGDGVKYLQTLLAADPSIYPQGTVSGFFGPLTIAAVKNFQHKHGIAMVGFIGPATLAALEAELQDTPLAIDTSGTATSTVSTSNGDKLCIPFGHMIAPGWQKHHEGEGDGPGLAICGNHNGDENNGNDNNEGEGNDHHGTTTPPVATLAISSVAAGSITSTGATITWMTNLGASSQVDYGTTTTYSNTSSFNGSLLTGHSVVLSGLMPSTTYHFRVDSTMGAQSVSSPDMSFTTSPAPDMTAPVISATSVSSIGSTTATVNWTTNENATSKVYFSTTTPINLSTAMVLSNATLTMTHMLTLSGLTASTTYQYVLESSDASNNTATTSAATFTTN